ncbi:hypothetical protein PYCC9005_004402 [Savitreella phatthalungensis]
MDRFLEELPRKAYKLERELHKLLALQKSSKKAFKKSRKYNKDADMFKAFLAFQAQQQQRQIHFDNQRLQSQPQIDGSGGQTYQYQRPDVPDKLCTRCGTNHWFHGPKATPCVAPMCLDCNRRHWQSGPSKEQCNTERALPSSTTAPESAIIERIYIDATGRQVIERTIPAQVAENWQRGVSQHHDEREGYSPTSPGFDKGLDWRASLGSVSPHILPRAASMSATDHAPSPETLAYR